MSEPREPRLRYAIEAFEKLIDAEDLRFSGTAAEIVKALSEVPLEGCEKEFYPRLGRWLVKVRWNTILFNLVGFLDEVGWIEVLEAHPIWCDEEHT